MEFIQKPEALNHIGISLEDQNNFIGIQDKSPGIKRKREHTYNQGHRTDLESKRNYRFKIAKAPILQMVTPSLVLETVKKNTEDDNYIPAVVF